MGDDIQIRAAEPADGRAVIELLRVSLGKQADPRYEDFFRWKHEQNPFGRSPAWVALSGGVVVGFRTFMRWEFVRDGELIRAVRAVDTATAPEFRGRGIFSRLTMHALTELREGGVHLVFNTPNSQSRPGYLKMGWDLVGRIPVAVRLRSLRSIPRVAGARAAAELWSEPTSVGDPADWLPDLWRDLAEHRPGPFLSTHRTMEYLGWRYGFVPLNYRVFRHETGFLVFRVRRRSGATELVVAEEVAGTNRGRQRLQREALRATGADYALMLGRPGPGSLPVPRIGPTLTCLPLNTESAPALHQWSLQMGDVELF